MKAPQIKSKSPINRSCKRRDCVQVDLAAILSVDHTCGGCARPDTCCCARYEVCVNNAELKRIVQVFPAAAKLCPHLKVAGGYDNVFEEVEPGLHAIDTTAGGLCVFAFTSNHVIMCSLHAVALARGLPPAQVKPKVCLLWPLSLSEDDEVLSLADDGYSFRCISRRRKRSRRIAPALLETIGLIYGADFRARLEKEARKGRQRARLPLGRLGHSIKT